LEFGTWNSIISDSRFQVLSFNMEFGTWNF